MKQHFSNINDVMADSEAKRHFKAFLTLEFSPENLAVSFPFTLFTLSFFFSPFFN
jgi:hypothetical protein